MDETTPRAATLAPLRALPPLRITTPTIDTNNLSAMYTPTSGQRTPSRLRAHTLAAIPRTPLKQIFTDFSTNGGIWDEKEPPTAIEENDRPGSASSSHSHSSNFSHYSLASHGGSCTSPEEDTTFVFPQHSEDATEVKAENRGLRKRGSSKSCKEKKEESTNACADGQWTQEMDDHLWRTYCMYQQDARMTPFYVVPGGVPPLGVCHRVVRAAKKTWKQMGPNGSPRSRVPKIQIDDVSGKQQKSHQWPASESDSRKRLRVLCKSQYGAPSFGPYRHGLQGESIRPGPPRVVRTGNARRHHSEDISAFSRSIYPTLERGGSHDSYEFSTRSMQLSLMTSNSTTMRPDSMLASWGASRPLSQQIPESAPSTPERRPSDLPLPFLTPHFANPFTSTAIPPTSTSPLPHSRSRTASLAALEAIFPSTSRVSFELPTNSTNSTPVPQTPNPSSLLPALELKSSSSPFGTWPRRRQSSSHPDKVSKPPTPPRRSRRQTLTSLFGPSSHTASPPSAPASPLSPAISIPTPTPAPVPVGLAPPPQFTTRQRGQTVSHPMPQMMQIPTSQRAHRSSESLSGVSLRLPLAALGTELGARGGLGSPFKDRRMSFRSLGSGLAAPALVGAGRSVESLMSGMDGAMGPPVVPGRGSSLGKTTAGMKSPGEEGGRRVKRMRE